MENEVRILPPSKYLGYFIKNNEWLRSNATLVGDCLIIERLRFPEKKSLGGIIIADSKRVQSTGLTSELPEFFRVLYVGAGYYDDETKADQPIDCAAGDILYLAGGSVKIWSSFPVLQTTDSDTLGICRYGDALWHFKGEEKFLEFLREFNSATQETVSQ